MGRMLRWVTATHTQRYHAHDHTSGQGHLYQARFKSFPVADDAHFLVVGRYVERNPLRAGLVARTEDWQYGSLRRWTQKAEAEPRLLSPWPIARTPNWTQLVNRTAPRERTRGRANVCPAWRRPFGEEAWMREAAEPQLYRFDTLRPRGRPAKDQQTAP